LWRSRCLLGRSFDGWEAGFEGVDDALSLEDAEGGLSYIGKFCFIFYFDSRHVLGGFDHGDVLRGFADGADGFVVVGVAAVVIAEPDGVMAGDLGARRAGRSVPAGPTGSNLANLLEVIPLHFRFMIAATCHI